MTFTIIIIFAHEPSALQGVKCKQWMVLEQATEKKKKKFNHIIVLLKHKHLVFSDAGI